MEYLIEFILELFIDGSIEASKSNKIPKPIRYLLIFIISLFFLIIITLLLWIGISQLKDNLLFGIFMILIGILFLILSVIKFKKVYLQRNDNN